MKPFRTKLGKGMSFTKGQVYMVKVKVHPKQGGTFVRPRPLTAEISHQHILQGLPPAYVQEVAMRLGIKVEDMAERCGISRSTFHRRLQTEAPLGPLESDVVARYSKLVEQATETFGGEESAAQQWLHQEQPGLGGAVPMELARTNIGAREVEKLLTRIDRGVYA